MDAFVKIAGGAVLAVGFLFVVIIMGTLFGALGGWVVGLIFAETVLGALTRFGVDTNGLTMWQLGAMLGFVGGFFRVMGRSEKK